MRSPIGQKSICFVEQLLAQKTGSFVNFINHFLKMDFLHKGFNTFLVYLIARCTQLFQRLEY